MKSGDWFKVTDAAGQLGGYTLQIDGHVYYHGKPVGTVEGDRLIADYAIGRLGLPNEPVECRGTLKSDTLHMDDGALYQLVPIDPS